MFNKKRILITGASNGLGKYLASKTHCDVFDRSNPKKHRSNYETIIHCAYNKSKLVNENDLYDYYKDTVFLTKYLVENIKSKYFIFISTIDVYPEYHSKKETDPINITDIKTIYGQSKLMCESIVKNHPNYLILRCSGLIGPNNLPKSINDILLKSSTTLTGDSTTSLVAYGKILEIISESKNTNRSKLLNVASTQPLLLSNMSKYRNNIKFGTFKYTATDVPLHNFKSNFPYIILPPSSNVLDLILK